MSEDLTILTTAVEDIDGNVVVPAGAAIGKSLLAAISGKGRPSGAEVPLGETDIGEAVDLFLTEEDTVPFFAGELRDRVAKLMHKITLPEPVVRELQRMRTEMPIFFHHSVATSVLAVRIALEITPRTEDLLRIGRATLLKDIGMTRIPAAVARNRDYLSRAEFFQIQRHPILGLVLNTYYFGEGLEGMVALRHHMRGGAGYPKWRGLRPSRLMDLIEVVDIFYALISPRPFRPEPYDVRGAIDELTDMAERGEVSEQALKLLVACYRSDKPFAAQVELSREKLGFVPRENFYGIGPEQ